MGGNYLLRLYICPIFRPQVQLAQDFTKCQMDPQRLQFVRDTDSTYDGLRELP